MVNVEKKRDLINYVAKHREKHPGVERCSTLTAARIFCFGKHRSRHGSDVAISHMPEGPHKSAARSFWASLGYDV